MVNIFNLIFLVVWSAVCFSTYVILFQSEPSYGLDRFYENHEASNVGVSYHLKRNYRDRISKHVFYWLYTRENYTGQLLNRSEPHMIESTTYNATNPIKVLVHGWMGRTTQVNESLCAVSVKSYLQVGEYNVICVDWKTYSTDMTYAAAKFKAKLIAKDIAEVLDRITYNMTEGNDMVHLIGHSMGAHIVGFVGKILTHKIPRITGLDPAKPLYGNSDPEDRLDITDSLFVDVLHTNGDQNGIFTPMGHIDFYPNGGKRQPNCSYSDGSTGACSHSKSYYYFAFSIVYKEDFLALNCTSWNEFKANNCVDSEFNYMGEFVDKEKVGDYYLETDKKYNQRFKLSTYELTT